MFHFPFHLAKSQLFQFLSHNFAIAARVKAVVVPEITKMSLFSSEDRWVCVRCFFQSELNIPFESMVRHNCNTSFVFPLSSILSTTFSILASMKSEKKKKNS